MSFLQMKDDVEDSYKTDHRLTKSFNSSVLTLAHSGSPKQ